MRRHLVKLVAVLITAVGLWFVAVDWSWFIHDCPDCGYSKDVAQYRVFTIAVHETTHDRPTITQYVARDLGVPCQHTNSTSWHKHRWWGLLVCKSPCINGVYALTGDDSWYDDEVSAKVTALAAADSAITDDFVQAVFENHDFSFVQTVLDRAGVEANSADNSPHPD